MIQFLFRKSESSRAFVPNTDHPREEKSSKQWTNKLASLVEDVPSTNKPEHEQQQQGSGGRPISHPIPPTHHTSLRLEGPYFTPANPHLYSTVICLVAGTGISGAIAIAAAFNAQSCSQAIPVPTTAAPKIEADATEKPTTTAMVLPTSSPVIENKSDEAEPSSQVPFHTQRRWKRCIIVWSVREADYIKLPFLNEAETPGLEIRTHLTGPNHERLNMEKSIADICAAEEKGSRTWVYLSGPNAFISTGEAACRKVGVEYYGARWS